MALNDIVPDDEHIILPANEDKMSKEIEELLKKLLMRVSDKSDFIMIIVNMLNMSGLTPIEIIGTLEASKLYMHRMYLEEEGMEE